MADALLIARLELRRMFLSPVSYVAGAVLQFVLAIVFFSNLASFEATAGGVSLMDAVVRPLFFSAGTMLLLATPMLTMHLISEEYRQGTILLLLSSPIAMTSLVLGKFLGGLGLMLFLILLFTTMPAGLLLFATIDIADLAVCVLAATLYALPITAIGLYASSLASKPLLAAMSCFGMLFALWLSDLPRHSGQGWISNLSDHISIMNHYQQLLLGAVSLDSILYVFLASLFFILLSIRRLHNLRTLH